MKKLTNKTWRAKFLADAERVPLPETALPASVAPYDCGNDGNFPSPPRCISRKRVWLLCALLALLTAGAVTVGILLIPSQPKLRPLAEALPNWSQAFRVMLPYDDYPAVSLDSLNAAPVYRFDSIASPKSVAEQLEKAFLLSGGDVGSEDAVYSYASSSSYSYGENASMSVSNIDIWRLSIRWDAGQDCFLTGASWESCFQSEESLEHALRDFAGRHYSLLGCGKEPDIQREVQTDEDGRVLSGRFTLAGPEHFRESDAIKKILLYSDFPLSGGTVFSFHRLENSSSLNVSHIGSKALKRCGDYTMISPEEAQRRVRKGDYIVDFRLEDSAKPEAGDPLTHIWLFYTVDADGFYRPYYKLRFRSTPSAERLQSLQESFEKEMEGNDYSSEELEQERRRFLELHCTYDVITEALEDRWLLPPASSSAS